MHALLAEQIARKAHEGQLEPHTFQPYILHVERVVALVEGDEAKAVAWLHDVLEDTPLTAGDLRQAGVPESIVMAVQILSRREEEKYQDYIARVRNSGAVVQTVKRADLKDHLRPSPYLKKSLRDRYLKAIGQLLQVSQLTW